MNRLYRKLNKATKKDHFPLPFIDEMLERLVNHSFFCFLDGYSGYHQILIHPDDQSKITFTCPYGTYAYRRMSFGLCNAPASFQRCMMSLPFEIMCDASDYAVGAVLGQTKNKKHHAIAYASKTLTGAQLNYATTEKSFWLLSLPLINLDLI